MNRGGCRILISMGRHAADVPKPSNRGSVLAGAPIVCSWCGRIKSGNGTWERPVAPPANVNARHGMCQQCRDDLIKDFMKTL